MHPSSSKGNNPELWNKLLEALDDRLQLGLLDHLKRVNSYHFEDMTLTLQPGSKEDKVYLAKSAVATQLRLFAEEIVQVDKIKLVDP